MEATQSTLRLDYSGKRMLASEIHAFFIKKDNPPADQLLVPVDEIKQSKKNPNLFYATMQYIVECCGTKTHFVNIRFYVDDKGRFIPNSFNYN